MSSRRTSASPTRGLRSTGTSPCSAPRSCSTPIVTDDGRIGHVELAVGGGRWMMSAEFASAGVAAPDASRGAAVSLHLEVDDVDALCERVVAAGVVLDRGPEDSPPAGRVAVFRDPFGHRWFLNQPLD
ncbi:VOC family protein [Nocardioides eburneiflavus]|uniref:VOC family protein n=1 Tax=Nocardioides eburneiflavus TaxID=2518372 RepID=UPI001B2FE80C|nr:VOC family protein [Nocardioides eburneiflavus]